MIYREMSHKWILLLALLVLPISIFGQRVIDETSVYNTREGVVFDTLTAERIVMEKKERMRKDIDSLKMAEEEIPSILKLAGKKITSERQLEVLNFIYNNTAFDKNRRTKAGYGTELLHGLLGAKGTPEGKPVYITIRKQLDKMKLSKEFIPYIESFQSYLKPYIAKLKVDLDKSWNMFFTDDDVPKKKGLIYTINPYYRPLNYDDNNMLDSLDMYAQSQGWEWIDNEEGISRSEQYPTNIYYKEYSSHPDYKIIKDCVYDKNGNLVRVIKCLRYVCNGETFMNSAKRCIFVKDYQNNKYNIAKEPSDVQYALRNRLGISDAAKKAAQAQYKQVFGAAVNSYTANTRAKYRKARAQGVQSAVGMMAELAKLDNATANAFLKQLEADHADEFTYLYRIERVDDKTFLVYFLNSSAQASLTFKITYTNEDKYTSTYQVTMVDTQPFSIDVEEIKELKHDWTKRGPARLNYYGRNEDMPPLWERDISNG